ncbi:CPBP family intramembrane glutamic endopeptidase [Streptomyces sp. N35]|uniref:CPBP family intramembrane glutamic endopeptidase n=1 Tax=Streptomyces sp. N35 TaxID=2795730 RepID=UPI0027DDF103|nr:CPBP family intramembrane glutamic endopeptidase [Streptomyces sp. N35]
MSTLGGRTSVPYGPQPRRWSLRRPVPTPTAVAAVLLVLLLTNVAAHQWSQPWTLLLSLAATGVLLAIVPWSGGQWSEVGLARDTLARGLRWALALIAVVALVYLVGALLPFTRQFFTDQRTSGSSGGEVAVRVLLTVPLGTVLLEEVAFRGVLYGLILRSRGPLAATLISSGLFGVWHILPSLGLADAKPALGSAFGDTLLGMILIDAGAVLFTAAAGCLFCELRRRSTSLLAPMGLHWATNALGHLFGFFLR